MERCEGRTGLAEGGGGGSDGGSKYTIVRAPVISRVRLIDPKEQCLHWTDRY